MGAESVREVEEEREESGMPKGVRVGRGGGLCNIAQCFTIEKACSQRREALRKGRGPEIQGTGGGDRKYKVREAGTGNTRYGGRGPETQGKGGGEVQSSLAPPPP